MEKSMQIANMLERVRGGEDPQKVRGEYQNLISSLNLRDITKAQDHLLSQVVTVGQVRTLVYAFASLLGDQFALLRANVEPGHIVRRIIAEHEMFEVFLADLRDVNEVFQKKDVISQFSVEFRKLAHAAEHLMAMDVHNQREDNLIFPYLKNYPCYSICRVLSRSHGRIKNLMENLIMGVNNFSRFEPKDFRNHLHAVTVALVPIISEHIFQEDNILLPATIEVIKDEKIWDRIKEQDDEMGYCAFDTQPCL